MLPNAPDSEITYDVEAVPGPGDLGYDSPQIKVNCSYCTPVRTLRPPPITLSFLSLFVRCIRETQQLLLCHITLRRNPASTAIKTDYRQ
jgi:hypothetical protein